MRNIASYTYLVSCYVWSVIATLSYIDKDFLYTLWWQYIFFTHRKIHGSRRDHNRFIGLTLRHQRTLVTTYIHNKNGGASSFSLEFYSVRLHKKIFCSTLDLESIAWWCSLQSRVIYDHVLQYFSASENGIISIFLIFVIAICCYFILLFVKPKDKIIIIFFP